MFVFFEIWCDWWIHVDVPVELWFHMRYLAKNLRKTRRWRCNDFWKAGAKTTVAAWMKVFEGDQLLVDRFKHDNNIMHMMLSSLLLVKWIGSSPEEIRRENPSLFQEQPVWPL